MARGLILLITMLISGGGDDPDTQSHDAEMLATLDYLILLKSNNGGSCNGDTEAQSSVFGPNTTSATVLLAHQYGRLMTNGDGFDMEVCDECFFELNDAADTVGEENRDLYLAFNRRVNSDYSVHDSYGVCSAKLSWVCNVAKP